MKANKGQQSPKLQISLLLSLFNVKSSKNVRVILKKMVFKIRDKRVEGKKGTQIKTGSICDNDGMKKGKILDYIQFVLDTDDIYKDVNKNT